MPTYVLVFTFLQISSAAAEVTLPTDSAAITLNKYSHISRKPWFV